MFCSGSFKCNTVKVFLKITIDECDEDSNSFESLVGNSDHQSLHPNYEFQRFQIFKQKCKSEKKKLSVQIENFIKNSSPHLVEDSQSFEKLSVSSTQEQNEIEDIDGEKMQIVKKKTGCTSACIIG